MKIALPLCAVGALLMAYAGFAKAQMAAAPPEVKVASFDEITNQADLDKAVKDGIIDIDSDACGSAEDVSAVSF